MNFLKIKLITKIAAAVLLCISISPVISQELKIGFVNVPILQQRAPQAEASMEALTTEFQPRQREIIAKQKEFDDLNQKVQRDIAVMGEIERRNAERDLRELQRELTRLQTEFNEDLNLRRNEELGKLNQSLLGEISSYAQSEGYDLVLSDGVLYASTPINITGAVLQAMEENFQGSENN